MPEIMKSTSCRTYSRDTRSSSRALPSHVSRVSRVLRIVLPAALALGFASSQAADIPSRSEGAAPSSQSSSHAAQLPPSSDASIRSRVEQALQANNISGVSVKSDMGVVSLSGTVPSEEARFALARIASAVDGVQGVETTNLRVKPTRAEM